MAESDSGTGEHDLMNDGTAPGSSLLLDHNISARTVAEEYTPGLTQRDGLNGALHLLGVDALGSVRGFINDDGGQALTDTFGAYAYGIPRTRTGTDFASLTWGGGDGYQSDPNGLVLMGNRVYHPYTGRFLTRDPAGAGDNDYEYADDNPLNEIDPYGLDPGAPLVPLPDGTQYGPIPGDPGYSIAPTGDPNVTRIYGNGNIMMAPGIDSPSASGVLRLGDNLLLNGAGSHYASVSSSYIRGDVGLGALTLASVLLVGSVALAIAPGGEEANLEVRGAEETAILAEKWGPGSFKTVEETLAYHFKEHGEEVGATNLLQYLRKADAFSQSLKRAATTALPNGYRFTKLGRYIIKDFEGKILSFGLER